MEQTTEERRAHVDADATRGQGDGNGDETIQRPVEPDLRDSIQTMRACASFADMLSGLLFRPLTQEQIDSLATRGLSDFMGLNGDFDKGINDISRFLRRRNTGTRQQLACDYTSAFIGTKTYEGKSAVPYESVFTSEDGLLCQRSFHEVLATYRREGFEKDDDLNIPEDHLSYMLEFVSVMILRAIDEIKAGDQRGIDDARQDLAAVREFVHEHILSWYGEFQERANLLLGTRFYRGVLSMGKGFLEFLCGELDAQIRQLDIAREQTRERV